MAFVVRIVNNNERKGWLQPADDAGKRLVGERDTAEVFPIEALDAVIDDMPSILSGPGADYLIESAGEKTL